MPTIHPNLHLRWRQFCGALMALALAISILGTMPFILSSQDSSSRMMSGAIFFLMWIFGLTGLAVFSIEDTIGKKLLSTVGFGWSFVALLRHAVIHHCDVNEYCSTDTNDIGLLFTICLLPVAAIILYNLKKEQIPRIARLMVLGSVRVIIVLWIVSLLLLAFLGTKPIKVRTKGTSAVPISSVIEASSTRMSI